MFKSASLCVLITVLFCFSQIAEVYANFRRASPQEGVFITIVAQEKELVVSKTNRDLIAISGQTPREKEKAIIGPIVKDAISVVIFFFIGKLVVKTVGVLKRRAVNTLSHAFTNWRDSLYHG